MDVLVNKFANCMSSKTKSKKTMMNIKIDASLKKRAQKIADSFGLPLSTIVSRKLEEFTFDKRIVFEKTLTPNAKIKKIIKETEKDIKSGKVGHRHKTVDSFMSSLSKE